MKNKIIKKAASIMLVLALLAAPAAVFADSEASAESASFGSWIQSLGQWIRQLVQGEAPSQNGNLFEGMEGQSEFGGQMHGPMNQMGTAQTAEEASEIQTSVLASNSAEELKADYANAETIVMSDSNNEVTIKEAGTYIVTGTCSDGNIKVKKGTEGVVLILKDLDLTSTTGATLSLNKGTETKVIIEGTVTLTDAEDTADEELDTYDGAAIKAKAGSSTVLTGTGTLNVNGEFQLQCRMPEGYSLQVSNMQGSRIIASLNPLTAMKPVLYLSIAHSELYSDVERLNDLGEEDLAMLEQSFREMNDVDISYGMTDHGTKLLVAREIGTDTDFVDIVTLYKGYSIEFVMTPNQAAADKTLTDAQTKMCIDFLSDLDFIPVA